MADPSDAAYRKAGDLIARMLERIARDKAEAEARDAAA